MKIGAITAEFNPFHRGHEYIVKETKKCGVTHLVAVMSGNYVQRGEPAILSKKARTEMALAHGVDLVVEMPTVRAISSAQRYAFSAIEIMNMLGCVDYLVFGSECGDVSLLTQISNVVSKEKFPQILKRKISSGINFAKAREEAISEELGYAVSKLIKYPNNNLGVEYLNALNFTCSNIKPITIKRVEHFREGDLISAAKIRSMIKKGIFEKNNFLSEKCFDIIKKNYNFLAFTENAERAILAFLRTKSASFFKNIPDVTEGLENKIVKSIKNSCNFEQLCFGIKSKRYTMSRIKRIILLAFLGITTELQNINIPYIKVLGSNEKGFEVLKVCKALSKVPIVTKRKEIIRLGVDAKNFFDQECKFSDLYGIFCKNVLPCLSEETFQIVRGENFELL